MNLLKLLHKITLSYLLTRIHTLFVKRRMGISIASGTRIFYKSKVINVPTSHVLIGKNCMIGRAKNGYHGGMPFYTTILNDGGGSFIKIGDNCRINGAYIHAKKEITIGDNCVIASGVNILDSNGHLVNCLNRTIGRDVPKPIKIGNNVWIGLNAVILKGCEIGDNCVIGAGCIVKGIVPSNCLIQSSENIVSVLSDDKMKL